MAIRVGDSRSIYPLRRGRCDRASGGWKVTQHCRVLDTDGAFDIVIGTDFLHRDPKVKLLCLQGPYALSCNVGSGLLAVPLELSGREECSLRFVNPSY